MKMIRRENGEDGEVEAEGKKSKMDNTTEEQDKQTRRTIQPTT